MRREFPDAMITGYEPLISEMTNDRKDRHVLAAAVRANAAIIVTANMKDFPPHACTPYDVGVVHPDDFLLDQLDLYEEETLLCIHQLVADRKRAAAWCNATNSVNGTALREVPADVSAPK